jgi:hypothetical protein
MEGYQIPVSKKMVKSHIGDLLGGSCNASNGRDIFSIHLLLGITSSSSNTGHQYHLPSTA